MAQIGALYNFSPNTVIVSNYVNSNFTDIKTAYNAHDTATTAVHGAGSGTLVITDAAQELTNKIIYGTPTAVSAFDIDWSANSIFTKSISANEVFTFSNTNNGQAIYVLVTSAGANTVSWPTVKWQNGVVPSQNTASTDLWFFIKIGSDIYGSKLEGMA